MTRFIREKNKTLRKQFCHVSGNCLERIGVYIPSGGIAIIDKNARPKIGDLVICTKSPGVLSEYCKQVKDIKNGNYIISTAYLNKALDFEFEAAEIRGVVLELYCKIWGRLVYKREKKNEA